jgi:hypothetical protein
MGSTETSIGINPSRRGAFHNIGRQSKTGVRQSSELMLSLLSRVSSLSKTQKRALLRVLDTMDEEPGQTTQTQHDNELDDVGASPPPAPTPKDTREKGKDQPHYVGSPLPPHGHGQHQKKREEKREENKQERGEDEDLLRQSITNFDMSAHRRGRIQQDEDISTTQNNQSNHSNNTSVNDISVDDSMDMSVRKTTEIPLLPRGKQLTLEILSTWGDPHYVGLSSIEMFNEEGRKIDTESVRSIRGIDINELCGGGDPRTVDKLLDDHTVTQDDLHTWLAPFNPGQTTDVALRFYDVMTLSMVRIWNYNKSRTHSYRGARAIRMRLDGRLIFEGELKKAPGTMQGAEQSAEIILFCMDQRVLSNIEAHDTVRFGIPFLFFIFIFIFILFNETFNIN